VRTARITILVAAVGAALLLGAASAAPSAALATTHLTTDRPIGQYYWPSSSGYYGGNGYGGYYGPYRYSGSGRAAWYGSGSYSSTYWDAGYYPGWYQNWGGSNASPYAGSPGYPYYDYGSHYGFGGPADVSPGYGPWAPGY